jgi:hypothetical protein
MADAPASPDSPPALPVNKAAQAANDILKGIENYANPLIQAAIIAAVPDLGLPVVKQIVDEIESILEDQITKYLETGADFIIYDSQTALESINVAAAQDALDAAVAGGDPDAISAAKERLANAEDALTTDDGSADTE